MKQTQELKLVLKNDVINGFSYSFSKTILEKLKEVVRDDRMFKNTYSSRRLTDIANTLVSHLYQQLCFYSSSFNVNDEKTIKELIAVAEEFLAIFEKK
ncbi:hypothetical protein HZB04_03805 [Candidatus Wolfebacteria bacterium]|nr:hypothetical protein [Candidatus Wolfebacteria bacterium]